MCPMLENKYEEHVPNIGGTGVESLGTCAQCDQTCGPSRGTCVQCNAQR
jgi:hypothetical protein